MVLGIRVVGISGLAIHQHFTRAVNFCQPRLTKTLLRKSFAINFQVSEDKIASET